MTVGCRDDHDDHVELTTDYCRGELEVRPVERIGLGLFTTAPIEAGEEVVVYGGWVTPGDEFRRLPDARQHHSLQIGDDLFMVNDDSRFSYGDFVNHSCEPNLVMAGEITLVAWRRIEAGEQLTYDYATSDASPYDEFECECASAGCRGKVTGEDWMRPELQRRYAGHFAPYLQRRISATLD